MQLTDKRYGLEINYDLSEIIYTPRFFVSLHSYNLKYKFFFWFSLQNSFFGISTEIIEKKTQQIYPLQRFLFGFQGQTISLLF